MRKTVTLIRFFPCICVFEKEGVSDQSMCVEAFDTVDTSALSSTTGGLWVDQVKTSRPEVLKATTQKSIQKMPINRTPHNWKERKEWGLLLQCFGMKEESTVKIDGSGEVEEECVGVQQLSGKKQAPHFAVIPICMIKICFIEQTLV